MHQVVQSKRLKNSMVLKLFLSSRTALGPSLRQTGFLIWFPRRWSGAELGRNTLLGQRWKMGVLVKRLYTRTGPKDQRQDRVKMTQSVLPQPEMKLFKCSLMKDPIAHRKYCWVCRRGSIGSKYRWEKEEGLREQSKCLQKQLMSLLFFPKSSWF